MKSKIFLLIFYILFIFNSNLFSNENNKTLKVGLLVPLSGPYSEIGNSLLYSLQLALEEINDKNVVNVDMTLTTPNCPVADSLPKQVKEYILKVKGVSDVKLNLVWDPPWDKSKMSEAAKLELNL